MIGDGDEEKDDELRGRFWLFHRWGPTTDHVRAFVFRIGGDVAIARVWWRLLQGVGVFGAQSPLTHGQGLLVQLGRTSILPGRVVGAGGVGAKLPERQNLRASRPQAKGVPRLCTAIEALPRWPRSPYPDTVDEGEQHGDRPRGRRWVPSRSLMLFLVGIGALALAYVSLLGATSRAAFLGATVATAAIAVAVLVGRSATSLRNDPQRSGIEQTQPTAAGPWPSRRWFGTSIVPYRRGRFNAALDLTGGILTLQFQPQFLANPSPLVVNPYQVANVIPVRGLGRSLGILIKPYDGQAYYFWLAERDEVLAELTAAGFPVLSGRQRRVFA